MTQYIGTQLSVTFFVDVEHEDSDEGLLEAMRAAQSTSISLGTDDLDEDGLVSNIHFITGPIVDWVE